MPKIFQQSTRGGMLLLFILTTILPSPAHAQVLDLPVPGKMLSLTKPYTPVMVSGLLVHPKEPFNFDFIINPGDSSLKGEALRPESMKLIKYFLAALAVPEEDMWVNLSPYEKDRIVPKTFGETAMGRDLLAQDYVLKQLTASLTYPEKEMGKKFWDTVYAQARQKFGTAEVPVDTFNKVWILPQTAKIYEHNNGAFVVENHLKVMLEEDYLAIEKNQALAPNAVRGTQLAPARTKASSIIRDIIVPALEKEVNEGAHFANLRQMYQAMILATWYKVRLKESILGKLYVDKQKTGGIALEDRSANRRIYDQYLQAFKKGVYNYIKEDPNPAGGQPVPRKYISGGFTALPLKDQAQIVNTIDTAMAARMGSRDSFMVSWEADVRRDAAQTSGGNFREFVQRVMSSGEDTFDGIRFFSLDRDVIIVNDNRKFIARLVEYTEFSPDRYEMELDVIYPLYFHEINPESFPDPLEALLRMIKGNPRLTFVLPLANGNIILIADGMNIDDIRRDYNEANPGQDNAMAGQPVVKVNGERHNDAANTAELSRREALTAAIAFAAAGLPGKSQAQDAPIDIRESGQLIRTEETSDAGPINNEFERLTRGGADVGTYIINNGHITPESARTFMLSSGTIRNAAVMRIKSVGPTVYLLLKEVSGKVIEFHIVEIFDPVYIRTGNVDQGERTQVQEMFNAIKVAGISPREVTYAARVIRKNDLIVIYNDVTGDSILGRVIGVKTPQGAIVLHVEASESIFKELRYFLIKISLQSAALEKSVVPDAAMATGPLNRQFILRMQLNQMRHDLVEQLRQAQADLNDLTISSLDRELYDNNRRVYGEEQQERESKIIFLKAKINSLVAQIRAINDGLKGDPAQTAQEDRDVGGIDLNAKNLDLQIKRDDKGMPLPAAFQELEKITIDGLYPVIRRIEPAHNLPLLLGHGQAPGSPST